MTFSIKKEKKNLSYEINYPDIALQSGFHLHQFRDGEMDWRFIGSVDVAQLVRDQNVEQLDGILLHLAEAPLSSMLDTNILESSIAKYFILSQYAVQYLLFCRSFLDETVVELRTVYADSERVIAVLRKSLSEANAEILKLHKKINEIEAIREVVYPCHLCTKNFVNNDALNLHISNKHTVNKVANKSTQFRSDQKPSSISPQRNSAGQRIKDYDLSLINRIMLELEIKQLKERINQDSEEKLFERNLSPLSECIERDLLKNKKIIEVGIQCNLSEEKETSKSSLLHSKKEIELESTSSLNEKLQIDNNNVGLLQEKIRDFEDWRLEQTKLHEQNIADIYAKFEEITVALDYIKTLKTHRPTQPELIETPHVLEDIERQLSHKIEQMAKLNREKIDQDLDHLKQNYNEKLKLFDFEIKNKKVLLNKESRLAGSPLREVSHNGYEASKAKTDKDMYFTTNEDILNTSQEVDLKLKSSNKLLDDVPSTDVTRTENNQYQNNSGSPTCSRRIHKSQPFVEKKSKNKFKKEGLTDKFENTDISKSLSSTVSNSEGEYNCSTSDSSSSLALKPKLIIKENKIRQIIQNNKNLSTQNIGDEFKKTPQNKTNAGKTRNSVNRILSRRLAEFGCEKHQKHLSFGKLKKILQQINNKRIEGKQFHITRNRLKKYVDELYSEHTKTDVEKVLISSHPLKPPHESKTKLIRKALRTQPISKSTIENQSQELSPMSRDSHIYKAGENFRLDTLESNTLKPMPLPRKRVMFNTKDLKSMESKEA